MNYLENIRDILSTDYHPDINTDESLREEKLNKYISFILKKQRENCANKWNDIDYETLDANPQHIYNLILNAPEPK